MISPELENLARIGQLRREPPSASEQRALLKSARVQLADARNPANGFESRFNLAYNAAHALALAALRAVGFRSEHRYLVFQVLPHTTGVPVGVWRVLAIAHDRRNLATYEGHLEEDERLLADLVHATTQLLAAVTGSMRQ